MSKKKVEEGIDKGIKSTRKFLRRLFLVMALLALLMGSLYMLWAGYNYSDGTRTGDLIKISKKGYIFKTMEGQLKLGGIDLANEDEGLSDTWSFSVKKDDLYPILENYQGQKVMLRYKEINRAMPWQGDTNYFVYEVILKE